MRVIIASGNIFRRELTSYVVGEAGYSVAEAVDLPALLASIAAGAPLAIVLDAQLGGAEPGPTLLAVRSHSAAPILWLAQVEAASPLLLADERPADALVWPYQPDELRARLAVLIGRGQADSGQTRSVGSAE